MISFFLENLTETRKKTNSTIWQEEAKKKKKKRFDGDEIGVTHKGSRVLRKDQASIGVLLEEVISRQMTSKGSSRRADDGFDPILRRQEVRDSENGEIGECNFD